MAVECQNKTVRSHSFFYLPPPPQPVAPVKPPVVAEWGAGVTPRLDPATISKHVKQMVDVSEKHMLIPTVRACF